MSTATEVMMRMQEAERRFEPYRKLLDRMASDMMARVFTAKTPLIRYGRRKRRHRRIYPATIVAMQVTFDGADVSARGVSADEFYQRS